MQRGQLKRLHIFVNAIGMSLLTLLVTSINYAQTTTIDLTLGNPSQANRNTPNNLLMERTQYVLSYNARNGGPNWVAWHLQRSDLGRVQRTNSFAPDPHLPTVMQIRPNDYTGSDYDRGHLCPSGDRTRTVEDNRATFLMSNMLPQTGDLNRHVWEGLESYCRDRVRLGNEMYIITGGHGSKGRIARGKVNVPRYCWKIVVELPEGNRDLARINRNTRVIAVEVPNEVDIANTRWPYYITTVDELERATGYNFLSNVPLAIQNVLEAKRDLGRASTDNKITPSSRNQSRNTRPATLPPSTRIIQPNNRPAPNGAGIVNQVQVWVNTKSGVYHYPNQRWYGKTKQGAYMNESEALRRGYRPSRNGQWMDSMASPLED